MTCPRPHSKSVAKLWRSHLSEHKAQHNPYAFRLMMELTRDPQKEGQALVDPKSWSGCGYGKTRPWPSVVWQWPSLGAQPR